MWEQERKHLAVMDKLQVQHRTRPTLLSYVSFHDHSLTSLGSMSLRPVAKAAGFALGATTALMGKEAAMACTEAVETVIGEHYDEYASPSPPPLTSTFTQTSTAS